MAKPFVKWAGGKTRLLDKIRPKYPLGLGWHITKYAEPFVGGGAVLFDVLNNYPISEIYISDVNRELIFTYISVRDNCKQLITLLEHYEQEYIHQNVEKRKEIYYKNRDTFNLLKKGTKLDLELAALFIFLNRTCFNGLYRVNSNGGFNVPQGSYANPCICDKINIRAVSNKLQNVEIICGDYTLSRNFIDERTFAYFDPPYRPLSATSSFTAYSQNGFGDAEQAELAKFIDEMSGRGAFVIASNSDPKNADKNDDFFDTLYSKHEIYRIDAGRAINSVGAGRGKVKELLICGLGGSGW